jgi:hypothetical protein
VVGVVVAALDFFALRFCTLGCFAAAFGALGFFALALRARGFFAAAFRARGFFAAGVALVFFLGLSVFDICPSSDRRSTSGGPLESSGRPALL